MILIVSLLLIFAIILRVHTPKKPNYLFGYQLGSAKKSIEHWQTANRIASNFMIVIYMLILGISLIFKYLKYDGEIFTLVLFGIGFIIMYFYIEKKLKKIA